MENKTGKIFDVEEVLETPKEKQFKVTDKETGRVLTMYESELKAKFTALTEDQAVMLMQKSRAERRQWLRDNKMKKVKRS